MRLFSYTLYNFTGNNEESVMSATKSLLDIPSRPRFEVVTASGGGVVLRLTEYTEMFSGATPRKEVSTITLNTYQLHEMMRVLNQLIKQGEKK